MRTYDVILIVNSELDETALNVVVEKVKGWITESGGSIEKVDLWGKRKLAYMIKKQRDGHYVLLKAQIPPTYCTELERNLRFTEPVLRSMIAVAE